jgi:hypothetical protein
VNVHLLNPEVIDMSDKVSHAEDLDKPFKKKTWWTRLLERMEKGGKEALKSGCVS